MNATNIFKNYSLDLDSYSYSSSDNMSESLTHIGGVINDIADGGFPPIYMCQKKEKVKEKLVEDVNKKREYKTHKTALSITEILEKRKKIT